MALPKDSFLQKENIDKVLSNYLSTQFEIDEQLFFSSKLAILDTVGCIFEAYSHDNVAQFARNDLNPKNFNNPFLVLDKIQSHNEQTWFLTVLTRWFDYNDTFLAKEWAHPSDNFGAIYSYFFKNKNLKFEDFIISLIQAYEIQGSLSLGTSLNKLGFDHVFFVKIAAGSVFANLLHKGDNRKLQRTVNNILADGPTLRSYRHFPNVGRRKSWAAADASRRGIELAILSTFDDEVYEDIQNDPNWGFEKVFMANSTLEFGKELDTWVMKNVLFKVLYPAEFHGQSAIEAAISLSSEFLTNQNKIESINVYTHEPAIRIISNKITLKNASDRDHSLEYMVAAGLLFGDLNYSMYEEDFYGFKEIECLRRKISVKENIEFTKNYYDFEKRDISNSVELVYSDGSVSNKVTVVNPLGHPSRRNEAVELLKEKFIKNLSTFLDSNTSIKLWEEIISIKLDASFADFANILEQYV